MSDGWLLYVCLGCFLASMLGDSDKRAKKQRERRLADAEARIAELERQLGRAPRPRRAG